MAQAGIHLPPNDAILPTSPYKLHLCPQTGGALVSQHGHLIYEVGEIVTRRPSGSILEHLRDHKRLMAQKCYWGRLKSSTWCYYPCRSGASGALAVGKHLWACLPLALCSDCTAQVSRSRSCDGRDPGLAGQKTFFHAAAKHVQAVSLIHSFYFFQIFETFPDPERNTKTINHAVPALAVMQQSSKSA